MLESLKKTVEYEQKMKGKFREEIAQKYTRIPIKEININIAPLKSPVKS